jgi:hypothetical protein
VRPRHGRVRRRALWNLTARPSSHCSSVISKRSIWDTAPEILTRASIRSNSWSVRKTMVSAEDGSLRSAAIDKAREPWDITCFEVSSSFSAFRATRTMNLKLRIRQIAVARPMPWLAPVTIATELIVG